jgi:hypothetical protein
MNFELKQKQGRTGHSSNAMLVAGVFTISHTKCLKKGLLKEFRRPFGFFCMECRKGLLIPVRLGAKVNHRRWKQFEKKIDLLDEQ